MDLKNISASQLGLAAAGTAAAFLVNPLLGVGVGLTLLTAGCGDETRLRHEEWTPLGDVPAEDSGAAPPLQDLFIPAPDEATPPSLSLNVTLKHCLGPLATQFSDLEAICPKNSETGECDPFFMESVSSFQESLVAFAAEQAEVSLWDMLDGHVSIPVTGVVLSRVEFPMVAECSCISTGTLVMTFGNHWEEISEYVAHNSVWQASDSGPFPWSHVRCDFHMSSNGWSYFYTGIYQRPKEGNMMLSSGLSMFFDPSDEIVSVGTHPATSYHFFAPPSFDISVASYAIRDFVEDGLERMEESSSGSPSYTQEYFIVDDTDGDGHSDLDICEGSATVAPLLWEIEAEME